MQKIEAIIRPEKLQQVKNALEELGVIGMTTYSVQGRGEQKGLEFTHRAGKFRVDFLDKTKIEIVIKDALVDAVVDAIINTARTGETGDGRIFISPMIRTLKVRTGEEEI